MLTALTFALILTSAVVVHELAHFLNARSVCVPVRAFSVGIGPVIARWRARGTEWRISLLPLGGYVDLPGMGPKVGEDGELRHPDEGIATKGWAAKIWVLIGGVIANYLLGIVLLAWAVVLQPGYRELTTGVVPEAGGSTIGVVVEGSAAEQLGILPGDRVLALNDVTDPLPEQIVEQVRSADSLRFTLERDGDVLEIDTAWPIVPVDGTPLLGVQIAPILPAVTFPQALSEAAMFGVRIVPDMVRGFVQGFGAAITGRENDDVAGPIGMVSLVNQATRIGLAPVILLAAVINFSLAVFNLLPIPGLDGGRMLLTTVIALRGKPFRPGQEEQLHFIGIMAVLALIVLITFRELGALFGG